MTNKKFNMVFSNPPYTKNLDLKILEKLVPLADELIVVHPTTWLMDKKYKTKLYNRCRDNFKVKSVELFNGNIMFKIGLFCPCSITYINNSYSGLCDVSWMHNNINYQAESLNDISIHNKQWINIVKSFKINLEKYIKLNGSVDSKIIIQKFEQPGKFYSQLAIIRGHVAYDNKNNMFANDFYSIVTKKIETMYGIRSKKYGTMVHEFDTEIERNNFVNYCRTKFARFCLSILKVGAKLANGELDIVPWLDFTQEWNDEKLFEFFEVSNELQKYILKFIPNYYNEDYDKYKNYQAESLNDISIFHDKWELLVKPFIQKFKKLKFDNIQDHFIDQRGKTQYEKLNTEKSNKFYTQFALIRGNVIYNDEKKILNDCSHTMITKNKEIVYGIRSKKYCMLVLEFDTNQERINFVNYCCTKFARFCLSILKASGNNLKNGEFKLIPWMDFTQEWTDKKLFKYFEVSDELKEYIEDFIPNYYEEDYDK